MEHIYKAAVIQLNTGSNKHTNLMKIVRLVKAAAAQGAGLVLLPETAEYIGEDMRGNAWSYEDAVQFYGSLAKYCKIYLHCGSFTQMLHRGSLKASNTSLLLAPDGQVLGKYSKMHLFDVEVEDGPSYKESEEIVAGDHICTVDTPIGMLGLGICYDIRFGEMFRLMSLQGAQVLCVCANFTAETGRAHWETLLRARAIENGCYVLAANQTGEKSAFASYGHSMIIDPWGRVLAHAGEQEEVIYAQVDIDYVNQVRRQIPVLNNRREDVYRLETRL